MNRADTPVRRSEEDLGRKRYVAAGDRAYVVGIMDGSFPFMGWHIKGLMGGVWTPPIKLLDTSELTRGQVVDRVASWFRSHYPVS